MKHRITAKIGSVLMAAAIVFSAAAMPADAGSGSTVSQSMAFLPEAQAYWKKLEMKKFPAGRYWNGGDAEHWTETGCKKHKGNDYSSCNGVNPGTEYSTGYSGKNFPGGLYQCIGFARKLAMDFYSGCDVWVSHNYTSGFQFRFGDQVTVRNDRDGTTHTIFVTEVNGNKIKFADCNWDNHCRIRWDVSASFSNQKVYLSGKSYTFVSIVRPAMEGDVTGDSRIMVDDLMSIYMIALGGYDFSNCNYVQIDAMKKAADLDHDFNVTMNDVQIACSQYDSSNGYLPNQGFLIGPI